MPSRRIRRNDVRECVTCKNLPTCQNRLTLDTQPTFNLNSIKKNKTSITAAILFLCIIYNLNNLRSTGSLGMPQKKFDYASKYVGGKVMKVLSTRTYIPPGETIVEMFCNLHRRWRYSDETKAMEILNPEVYPGKCWMFQGSKGAVILKLAKAIKVTGMTISHGDGSEGFGEYFTSAPKNIILSGLKSLNDNKEINLGNYIYHVCSRAFQFFQVRNISFFPFEYIKINVTSNWGNNNYTCMYRVEIHGETN